MEQADLGRDRRPPLSGEALVEQRLLPPHPGVVEVAQPERPLAGCRRVQPDWPARPTGHRPLGQRGAGPAHRDDRRRRGWDTNRPGTRAPAESIAGSGRPGRDRSRRSVGRSRRVVVGPDRPPVVTVQVGDHLGGVPAVAALRAQRERRRGARPGQQGPGGVVRDGGEGADVGPRPEPAEQLRRQPVRAGHLRLTGMDHPSTSARSPRTWPPRGQLGAFRHRTVTRQRLKVRSSRLLPPGQRGWPAAPAAVVQGVPAHGQSGTNSGRGAHVLVRAGKTAA